ncbi:MAG: 3-deoxy-manno-octulosonate cytidylyltransferase [Nitrospirae bacterium]|nr:3-deoxy-manno-octulosonate cytidylyltransferase [Nitrospirota bacterium]
MVTVVGVIPARYASKRLPGKPLRKILGKPMIEYVHRNATGVSRFARLVIATDSDDVARAAKGFGAEVLLTSPNHTSGTDRVAEVADRLEADLFVNIQGDEPLLSAASINRVIDALLDEGAAPMATLKFPLDGSLKAQDPNVVKVVTDEADYALYFSRSLIPHNGSPFKHIGLYGYTRDFLRRFASWAPTPLEKAERLEQLRALEKGARIKVPTAAEDSYSVDTIEDLIFVEKLIRDAA